MVKRGVRRQLQQDILLRKTAMLTLLSLKKTAQIVGSVLIFAAVGSLLPAVAEDASVILIDEVQPRETPTGTIQDLQGLESQTAAEWLWGVGGEYEANVVTSQPQLQPVLEKVQQEQRDWPNLNR
ncbi:MAG: hypothetical protein ACKO7A_12985, partial [Microcystis sp.]